MASYHRYGSLDPFIDHASFREDTTGMMFPTRCLRCGHVHDAAQVTVVQRYADCSTWRCPSCDSLIDDRPAGWGGSEPVRPAQSAATTRKDS